MMLEIEIGEDAAPSTCACCGVESRVGHGFIYNNKDAYAVYYVGWTPLHRERGVTLAVAIGEWGDGSAAKDRTCFGLEVHEGERQVLIRFIEPEESPWSSTEVLGPMISRNDSLNHNASTDVLRVAEYIVREHPSVREFLGILT
jgi:hypothetical protein